MSIQSPGPSLPVTVLHLKLLSFIIGLFGFLMTVWYAALLMASQAVSVFDPTILTMEVLRKTGTHRLCVREGSFAQDQFRVNPYDVSLFNLYILIL